MTDEKKQENKTINLSAEEWSLILDVIEEKTKEVDKLREPQRSQYLYVYSSIGNKIVQLLAPPKE